MQVLTFGTTRSNSSAKPARHVTKRSAALWTVQGLLALTYLAAGGMKLAMPAEMLAEVSPFPVLFVRFIACCELLGAAGLILPGLLRIRPALTGVAASCLIVIMLGAVVSTVLTMDVPSAIFPFVIGVLDVVVAYNRLPRPSQAATAPALRLAA